MSRQFVVQLADLEHGEKHAAWEVSPAWLSAATSDTEAEPRGGAGHLELVLQKNGRDVVVRGRVDCPLTMPCARTLDPVDVDIDAEVFLMLSPAPPEEPGKRRKSGDKGRKRRRGAVEPDRELSDEEAAVDTFTGDEVVLDDYIREFILLELPLFPLRSPGSPAISSRPDGLAGESTSPSDEPVIDPRLAPLQEIAQRMRKKEE